jgi:DNA-binding NarL/FixJ family response regulator
MTMRRVAVVDDDDLSRRGMAELLADRPEVEVVASLTHDQAMTQPRWDQVQVAVVDAADEREDTDQFPGVEVVEAIRHRGGDHTVVVVVTGHFFDDAVRRRMREAGADFFYNRIDLHDAAALYRAVCDLEGQAGGVPAESDPEALFRLGVTEHTKVNDGVRYGTDHPMVAELSGGAIRRARARLRYRLAFGRASRLSPVNSDGRPPERDQEAPSLPQMQRFLDWATKAKRPHP